MAKVKKLGALGGVFMPSILSILGVIMYMRLPWIVGQAGLYAVLGIILVAHIISVSTGLSIASIATDKKVKAGGMYYMISRSLGLPIGGTLGLALFIGISFSISLYLVGFSEAFLSYFGFDTSLNSIRLTGFIALCSVAIITFISTKLAIKTQYFIFAAVILSLLSIVLGSNEFVPSTPNLKGVADALPWIVLFGIFFPAVTGFGAGVSMSGDLSNPNKAIPRGTIAAILTGLVVYILLAFFFAFNVSPEQLVHNPEILFDVSRVKVMVAIGIWAATLSSALGGILSAPRILQAMSKDSITPRFFARGYGGLNEPRNALLLCFLIATSGILIGELNVIARVVSVFFIITYGFLNLSCFIEAWASSDFRPTFRVHPAVSLIGAIACIIVMIQLDVLAMFAASLILFALFLYLKRKELSLRSGDTWDSVWESVIRSGLGRLKNRKINMRNWRPNILIFSGGTKARPFLTEIGSDIIGKLGMLTDFEIIIDKNKENCVLKNEEDELEGKTEVQGNIFKKIYVCADKFQGIESIAQLYGFSGIEPNTIMLGLPKSKEKYERFIKFFNALRIKDFNKLFINYNETKGFGSKKRIDFWWDGSGGNLFYGIVILRYFLSGDSWRHAQCRFNYINNENIPEESLHKNIKSLLAEFRIHVEIEIHNNAIEGKETFDVIKANSKKADLIIHDIPEMPPEKLEAYLHSHTAEFAGMPSVLLTKACKTFAKVPMFAKKHKHEEVSYKAITDKIYEHKRYKLPDSKYSAVNSTIADLDDKMQSILLDFHKDFFLKIHERNIFISAKLKETVEKAFKDIAKTPQSDKDKGLKAFYKIWHNTLSDIDSLAQELTNAHLTTDRDFAEKALAKFMQSFDVMWAEMPERIILTLDKKDFATQKGDSLKTRFRKSYTRFLLTIGKKEITRKLAFKKAFERVLRPLILKEVYKLLVKHQNNSYTSVNEIRQILEHIKNIFFKIEISLNKNSLTKETISEFQNEIIENISKNNKAQEVGIALYQKVLFTTYYRHVRFLISQLDKQKFKTYVAKNRVVKKDREALEMNLNNYASHWHFNTKFFAQQILIDVFLQTLEVRIKTKFIKSYSHYLQSVKSQARENFGVILKKIDAYISSMNNDDDFVYDLDSVNFQEVHYLDSFEDIFSQIKAIVEDMPEVLVIPMQSIIVHNINEALDEIETKTLPLRKHIEDVIENIFNENINHVLLLLEEELNKKFRKLNNTLSLARYNIDTIYTNDTLSPSDEISNKKNYLKELRESFEAEKERIWAYDYDFFQKITQTLKKTFDPVTLSMLYNPKTGVAKVSAAGKAQRKPYWKPFVFIKTQTQKGIEWLFYGRSLGILFAKRMHTDKKEYKVAADSLLEFVEAHTPNKEVVDKLPFYYKNLFNNKFTVNQRLWVGRTREMDKARNAVRQFKSGSHGAILVLGERNSGKTSLSNQIAQSDYPKENIFYLFPPRQGSASIKDFEKSLALVTGINGSAHYIMRSLPGNSCIVINDLALWWERSPKGVAVIKLIAELIMKYSSKCLFVINSNIYAFGFINKLVDIQPFLLTIIHCEPFTTYELRNLILKRHQSSEMTFKLGKLSEALMIEWRYAQLFNSYFNYSDGIIGTALNAWLVHIKEVNDKELLIKKPRSPEINVFSLLDNVSINICVQFVLHRRLNSERLTRIMNMSANAVDEKLRYLLSVKILDKFPKKIYMLNSYIEPHLVKYLKTGGML